MLPFSKYMHKISPLTGTPIISVWVNVLFCALLGLIDLASYTAIAAIFNVFHIYEIAENRSVQSLWTGVIVSLSSARYSFPLSLINYRYSGLRISLLVRLTWARHLGMLMSTHVYGPLSSVSFSYSRQSCPSLC
jgi:hypothetical protein